MDSATGLPSVSGHSQGVRRGLCLWVILAGISGGCDHPSQQSSQAELPTLSTQGKLEAPDLCEARVRELYELPALSGAPEFEAHRVEILGRARSIPVFFTKRPGHGVELEPLVATWRQELLEARDPVPVILDVLRRTRYSLERRRAVFLSSGYLYSEQPLVALRLSQVIRLDHLFDANLVRIHRGDRVFLARRAKGKYWIPPEGESAVTSQPDRMTWREASVLLLDRVEEVSDSSANISQFSTEPLHLDFTELRSLLGFEKVQIERLTAEGTVVSFLTGSVETMGIVQGEPFGRARLECESWSAREEATLFAERKKARFAARMSAPVLEAAREMVSRRLPFDEPRTEEGQQDGQLRVAFRNAYKRYHGTYEFNGDAYYVFDGKGRVRLPQVCIDFITDSFDWATGGRWPDRNEKRRYRRGALNFASFGIENSRSVDQISGFASDHPEWFDVHWLEDPDRVKFYKRQEFFEALDRTSQRYRPGDVVFIYGLRDDERFHYHSFFIDTVDPLTGAPILVAANAGPPQVRTWEGEMSSAPRRRIVARVRVRPEVLQRAYALAEERPGEPLVPPRALVEADE